MYVTACRQSSACSSVRASCSCCYGCNVPSPVASHCVQPSCDCTQGSQFHLNSVIRYVIARTAAEKDAAEEGRRLLQSLDPDGTRCAGRHRRGGAFRFGAAIRGVDVILY